MSAFLDITSKEQAVIDQLKKRTINDVTPKMLEDQTLFYRFAKARDFKLEAAENMLRKHIAWRKEVKMDTFLTDYKPPEVLEKYLPISVLGCDKEGSVVRYIDTGKLDVKHMWHTVRKIDMCKTAILEVEKDNEMSKQKAKKNEKFSMKTIYLHNFEDLTFANVTDKKLIEASLQYTKIYLDNYPETLKSIIVINAPIYFSVIYSYLKPILPTIVNEKIRIYGTNDWKEALLELIDADELPAFLGGNKTDPDGDPSCKTFIKHGQPFPEQYYFCNIQKMLVNDPNAKKISVARSSKDELCFEIEKTGSYIEWEFETKNKDIGFAVYFKENVLQDPVELIPYERRDTCYGPEKGFLECKKVGIYTFLFDNSYSWMYTKEVYCKIQVKHLKDVENH